MIRKTLILLLLLFLMSCAHNEDKKIIELIKTQNKNLTYIGKAGPEYFFNFENISGRPFTDSFNSISQILAFVKETEGFRKTVDTIFYTTNNYSDIKFDSINSKFNSNPIELLFEQCPDGNDECIKMVYVLPSLNQCPSCR